MTSLPADVSLYQRHSNILANPEKRKLRASCDGCYLSKVKCTKETPTCARCLDHNTICRYSPSQRTGKPRRALTEIQEKEPSLPADVWGWSAGSTALTPNEESIHPIPLLAWNHESSPLGLGSPDNLDVGALQVEWQRRSADGGIRSRTWSNTSSPQLSYASSYRGSSSANPAVEMRSTMAAPAMRKSFDAMLWQQDSLGHLGRAKSTAEDQLSSSSPTSLSLDTPTSLFEPPDPEISFQSPSCSCPAKTFEVLRTLHERSSNPLTPFDTILAINKDVSARISATLECPFQHDVSTIMTLAASITRILAWYRSIFVLSSHHISPQAWRVASESTAMPISLGAYRLDGEDEKVVKIQVALNELKKIDVLLARIPGTQSGSSDKLAIIVNGDLTTFLRRRLREVGMELQRELGKDFGDEI